MRKSRKGFWRALERLAGGAVRVEWESELGHETERAVPLVRPANGLAKTYPCTNPLGCECPHRVEELAPGRWLAVCGPDDGCLPIPLKREDLVVYGVDTGVLCGGIARCLGLGPCGGRMVAGARAELAGTHGPARSGVYLMFPGDGSRMTREVERLFCAQPDPFVLLTPTGIHCTADVESALRRQACMHIALSEAVVLRPDGSLAPSAAAAGLLAEFVRRCGEGRGLAKAVERIDRNMDAVARGDYELRKENEELRQLNKDGYFNFAVRVKGEDFLAFAVIMALGNRKAAAEHLKIPHRTLYNRVEQWTGRGKDYQLMLRYMGWRKRSARHLKVELNPSLQSGDAGDRPENPETMADVLTEIAAADNRDYPAMFADVLQALERQNAGNWMKVRQELVEMIKEDVMQ